MKVEAVQGEYRLWHAKPHTEGSMIPPLCKPLSLYLSLQQLSLFFPSFKCLSGPEIFSLRNDASACRQIRPVWPNCSLCPFTTSSYPATALPAPSRPCPGYERGSPSPLAWWPSRICRGQSKYEYQSILPCGLRNGKWHVHGRVWRRWGR